MTDHPNARRIHELFAAFRAGDVATIRAVLHPDAVWHFPGRRGRLAGAHRGHDAIFGFLLDVQAATDGTFGLDLIDVLANDRHAAVFFRGHATRAGRTLDNPTCLRIRFAGEQVAEVWECVGGLRRLLDPNRFALRVRPAACAASLTRTASRFGFVQRLAPRP